MIPIFSICIEVNFDGTELTNLTPEIANHQISWSESAEYFSDVYSTPNTAPVSVVRNKAGETQLVLEETDIGPLITSGWVAPESIHCEGQRSDHRPLRLALQAF